MYRKIGKLEVVKIVILLCRRFNTGYRHCHSLQPYSPAVTHNYFQTTKSVASEMNNILNNLSLQLKYNTTPWAIKKGATFIFTITLANVDRFQ